MTALQTWLLAVSATVSSAFMDRSGGIHLFSLPELKSNKHRILSDNGHIGQGYRMLLRNEHDELPELHDSHKFVGATSMGFVDYDMSSITPPTTIQSDDYLELLRDASFACVPVPVIAEGAAAVHRLSVTFPGGAPSDTEAFAHLASRFVTAAAFVYGVETLLSHPDLGTTSSCVVHAGSDSPYFGIVGATADADGFVLTLTPTSPARVFSYMSMKLVYNPNITGEVIKRRAAGLDVGDERRLGTGKTLTTKLADFSLNWDKVNKKATTEKLALIGTSSLYCNNCYFYLDASITVNVKVCAIRPTLLPLSYYYYDADAATGNSASSTGICGAGAAGCYATEAAARASTDCGDLKTVAGFFNLGMSVEGYFDGAAGFNFEIKSDGIASKVGWPTSCQSDSATCAPEAFPAPLNAPFAINTITISAAGVPVTIDPVIQLKGAGIVDGNMPNLKLSFGASAAVKAKLGAKVSFTDIPSSYVPALNTVPYKDFTATYSTLPFILSGFADTALSTDVTISPIITLTVWKLVPIISKPTYTFNYNLAAKTTARRLGNNGSAARELVTCAAGTAKSSAGLKGALGVELGSVRTFGVVKAATGLDLSTLGSLASQFDVILIPATVLVANAAIDVSGALSATAAEMCVTKDVPVNTGTAINAAVGSSGSGSASDSSSPIANTPLAVWLGLGLGVGLGLAIPLIALSIYTSRLLRRMEKAKNNLTMTSTVGRGHRGMPSPVQTAENPSWARGDPR